MRRPRPTRCRPLRGLQVGGAAFLLLLFLLALTGRAEDPPAAPKPSRVVHLPVGVPVRLDGRVDPDEWADAASRPLGPDGSRVLFQQCRGTLLLALESAGPWPEGSRLWFAFTTDQDGAGLYSPGAVHLDLEPFQHDRPHTLALALGPTGVDAPVERQAVAAFDVRDPRASLEVAVDLSFLGVGAMQASPRRVLVLWARGGGAGTETWPPDLELEPGPDGKAPDLASSESWGRLSGWVDPDGPGAWAPATWKAMLDRAGELARRGRDAYAAGFLIDEEPELAKRDSEQVPAIEGNLDWIAEREPLTPEDLLLLARGYRFLNRQDEALAVLRSLDLAPAWRGSPRLLYERALCYESVERYPEAAALWEALASNERATSRAHYQRMAERARRRATRWKAEQEARRADEARSDLPLVLLRTERGNVTLLLDSADVPEAVGHFLSLALTREDGHGFYDGTRFHRVLGGFLAQGGDPTTRGSTDCQGAGTGDGPEKVGVETNPRHGFWRGAVGFARGPRMLNGSQFFILTGPRPELEKQTFTCFGHVVSGMDVVDRLETCDELIEVRVLSRGAPLVPAKKPVPEGGR